MPVWGVVATCAFVGLLVIWWLFREDPPRPIPALVPVEDEERWALAVMLSDCHHFMLVEERDGAIGFLGCPVRYKETAREEIQHYTGKRIGQWFMRHGRTECFVSEMPLTELRAYAAMYGYRVISVAAAHQYNQVQDFNLVLDGALRCAGS